MMNLLKGALKNVFHKKVYSRESTNIWLEEDLLLLEGNSRN